MSNSNFEYDVFISYSHKDIDWVQKYLYRILESMNLNVVIDDNNFLPGQNLTNTINDHITKAGAVVFVCTKHFNDSEWCQKEVELTLKKPNTKEIPLVLEGALHVPKLLGNTSWCDLTTDQGSEREWKQLCQILNGTWTSGTDEILEDLRDISSFFGGFMNNSTPTAILNRSHLVTSETIPGVAMNHLVDLPTIQAYQPLFLMLGQIGKVSQVDLVLMNSHGDHSSPLPLDHPSANFLAIGGSGGNTLVKQFGNRSIQVGKYYGWMKSFELSDGSHFEFDWKNRDQFLIYKTKTTVRNNLIYFFSPHGPGNQWATQTLLNEYRPLARKMKGKEFLRVYNGQMEATFTHVYGNEVI